MFFNKDGFPHNFQYNKTDEKWEGKIIFDENSDQTFRTQSLYLFEQVDPIEFSCTADLVKIVYFNYSGLTITGEANYSNEVITNIQKVNNSDQFYSKWIFGDKFDKKFPTGTIITFSGVTGSPVTSDFSEDQYFTVLQIKKNAVMVYTKTDNSVNFTFSSGYINKSLNVISINDYNQNLSGNTFFENLYSNKKLSIINSKYNNSVISVNSGITQSGITKSYINELKLSGLTGQLFTLRVKLLTERPKLFQGNVKLFKQDTKLYIDFGKLNSSLQPTYTIIDNSGNTKATNEIIFQDAYGEKIFSGYTFTIKSLLDSEKLGSKVLKFEKVVAVKKDKASLAFNIIEYSGAPLNIIKGDTIKIINLTETTSVLNDNRELTVLNTTYNAGVSTLFIDANLNNESGNTYSIYKKLKPYQISTVQVDTSGLITTDIISINDAYCYSTSNILNFYQTFLTGSTSNITSSSFVSRYNSTLNEYGINTYSSTKNNAEYLTVESLYGTKNRYFEISGYTNGLLLNNDFTLSNNGFTNRYDIITNEKLTNEKYFRSDTTELCRTSTAEILLNLNYDTPQLSTGTTNFGFRLTLNSNEYFTEFIADTQTTINNFIDIYENILYNNGFEVYSGYSSIYTGYTLNIKTTSPDLDIWNLNIMVNILSTYKIIEYHQNKGIVISGNEIRGTNFFDYNLATGMIIKISGCSYSLNNKEYNIVGLSDNSISISYQGTFEGITGTEINIKSREFIRKPRGNYNRDIYLKAYWEIPYDGTVDESIFFYDITGNQLVPYNNNNSYKYIGPTPLIDPLINNVVFLNSESNRDTDRISNPKYQQTVFDELNLKLEQLDSVISNDWIPEPLEIFVGYNSTNEGVNYRVLKIEKIECFENTQIKFNYSGATSPAGPDYIDNFFFENDTLYYNKPDFNFLSYGFEPNQLISFDFKDQMETNQIIFENIGTYSISSINRNRITINTGSTSGFTYFSTTGSTFNFIITVEPKEILSCVLYGQTEVEDLRFKVNLNNVGIQVDDDVYQILYKSDIQDNAIDYTILNQKRKEMLTTYREIFDYIGSYKALINAINFFGFNKLQLYEYYQNIDKESPLWGKLHKVLIPDIFDNTIEGWNEIDFIAGKYQDQSTWTKSNLFNLAYQITDENGDNTLIYSLEEVQYKLTKLKVWLRNNIIPISANLIDITGVADTNQTLYQDYDESNQTTKLVVERNSTVVNFNYTATLNFGTDYLISVNFYILSGVTGTTIDYNEVPLSFSAKIKTFFLSGDTTTMIPVQYQKINKTDLSPYSFNINKNVDPYIYIETTTYDNDGNGIGYVNNKMFYFDEPRNHWIVNHNFDMKKMKYYQTQDYITNTYNKWNYEDIVYDSSIVSYTIVDNNNINTLNKTHTSKLSEN